MNNLSKKQIYTLVAVVLYVALYYFWLIFWKEDIQLKLLGGNLFSIAAPLFSAVSLYLVNKQKQRKDKIFWLLLSLGCQSYFAAEFIWIYYENILKVEVPFPGYTDLFYILQIVFYFAAFTYKFFRDNNPLQLAKYLFDIAIILTAAATFSLHFLINPIISAESDSPLSLAISIGYPIGDLALLLAAFSICGSWYHFKLKSGYLIVFSSLFIQIIADSSYLYLVSIGTYNSGSMIDPLYTLSLLLMGVAGVFSMEREANENAPSFDSILGFQLFPYLSVLVLFVFLFSQNHEDNTIVSGAGIAILLIITRQLLILLENKRLLEKYHARTLELAMNKQRYRSLFEYHPDAVFSVDTEGHFLMANSECSSLIGYEESELIGKSAFTFISKRNQDIMSRNFYEALQGNPQKFEVPIQSKHGKDIYVGFTIVPIKIDDRIVGIFGIAKDITEVKKNEEKISYMAYHDLLTNLPNRRLFERILNQSMLDADRRSEMLAVMFIDLDRFKLVNDTLGHNVGDQLLLLVAQRLESCLRANDVIARQGGDEFTLLAKGITQIKDISHVAQKIIDSLNQPYYIHERELLITPSIGIAIYPRDGLNAADLMKNADSAMYKAKENGKNGFSFYATEMIEKPSRRLILENDLHKAIVNHELSLHYQPQYNMDRERITGVEALLRWTHPELGPVSPGEFIPIIEESGLIIPIGEWALREACQQTQKWRQAGHSLVVGVNLSPRQFYQKNLEEMILGILKETGLPCEFLDLEITEGIAMSDRQMVIGKLTKLRNHGIKVSIDDFGTGYSSLAYLTNYPIDTLKVAREFVEKVGKDSGNEAIIATIIAMAKNLRLSVIAEGVETEAQAKFLHAHGCSLMQGYLFGKPVPPAELDSMLKNQYVKNKY